MADKIFNELYDAYEKKGAAVKKTRGCSQNGRVQ